MHCVELSLRTPFESSLGVERERKSLILDFRSEGIRAFSECATFENPYYSFEDNSTAIHIIRDHLAEELKKEPSPEEFLKRTAHIRGHNMAKAAVEMLLWDFHCKLKNVSIAEELGNPRGHARVGISLGFEDNHVLLLKKVEAAVKRGYRRIKIKIKRGTEYHWIKSVRDSYPELPLSIDANGCYTLKDVQDLKRLDKFDLLYIEQPLEHDDLIDHAVLAKQISTPICLDESISSPRSARQAFESGAAKIVNIKPGRLGGLVNSVKIGKIAREYDGGVWVGGMLETGIGRSFNVALASQRFVGLPGDTSPNDEYFLRDIVNNPFEMTGKGTMKPNTGPGIGVELDDEFLKSSTKQSLKIF
ncbi:MAG: o-succinylbenzoate synthase [Nitrososphaerota archaeon]|nr:o-succinylbenzoate synthase [Nitrososphaerota archaeon]